MSPRPTADWLVTAATPVTRAIEASDGGGGTLDHDEFVGRLHVVGPITIEHAVSVEQNQHGLGQAA